jgi:hypothetical protein
MLKILSSLNIILAFLYFMCYLQQGSYYVIAGMILVLVFNWQTLRSLETRNLKWMLLQYFTGVFSLMVSVFLLFSAWNLIASGLANNHFELNLLVLETFSLLFGISNGIHCILSFLANRRADQFD